MITTIETSIATTAGSLQLINIEKAYDHKRLDQKAVSDINLSIEAGTFVTLLGPSGCGKTTTLRMIAGFEQPTGGEILVDGASIVSVTPDKRPMSMVFQSYALFPHLTVRDNVAFGLKLKRLASAVRDGKVAEGLRMMGIEQYADRYPHQLSGGQQQRVALARALVMEPKIVLFDEPLSNLDARLRVKMREEIRALQQRLGLTAIFVTHDQSEAMTMSDLVVVMSAGRIEQIGTPSDLYHRPANHFVASFLGTSNFVDAVVRSVQEEEPRKTTYEVETGLGRFRVGGVPGLHIGDEAELVLRMEDVRVGSAGRNGFSGTVQSVAFDGGVTNYTVGSPVGPLAAQAPGAAAVLNRGEIVEVAVTEAPLWLIPTEGSGGPR